MTCLLLYIFISVWISKPRRVVASLASIISLVGVDTIFLMSVFYNIWIYSDENNILFYHFIVYIIPLLGLETGYEIVILISFLLAMYTYWVWYVFFYRVLGSW